MVTITLPDRTGPVLTTTSTPAARHTARPAAPEKTERPAPGRAHLQQGLKHLLRDVRQDVKSELHDLEASGGADPAYAAAVEDLVADFRDGLQDVFHDAGRGRTYDRPTVLDGVGQAMADLTAGLKALREERDGLVATPVETPDREPTDEVMEAPVGALIDTTA